MQAPSRFRNWAQIGLVASVTAALGCIGLGLGSALAVHPYEFPTFAWERDIGLEPTTFSLGNTDLPVAGGIQRSQGVGIIQGEMRGVSKESPDLGQNRSPFVTRLLPGEPRQVLNGGGSTDAPERLMSVAEVAERLGVKPVTVYKLCTRGRLAHVRVLNALRVAPSAVAEFLNRQIGSSSARP
jgi:excisionase family DNA binding protein